MSRTAPRCRPPLSVEALEERVVPTVFTVTTTVDAGPGSLRQAVHDANAAPDLDTVAFNIPGEGLQTIAIASALPPLIHPVVIDGFSQPGASPNTHANGDSAVRLIELDGTNAGPSDGLVLAGSFVTVRGLVISNFTGHGIRIVGSDNTVEGNSIGAGTDGDSNSGNGGSGVSVGPAVVYQTGFEPDEDDIGTEWSNTTTAVTETGDRTFLGEFGTETVTLTIPAADIPAGTTALTISFELFVIRSWDGNHGGGGSGPDRWSLTLGSGLCLLDTTFSNNVPNTAFAGQAYPGVFGTGQFDPHTGTAEVNTLGFTFGGEMMDSVYRPRFTFSYTGGDVVLHFAGALTTPGSDESWGLDNVEVRAVADAYSAPNDFSVASNPNGPWTYGWSPADGSAFHPYPNGGAASAEYPGGEVWNDPGNISLGAPAVLYNPTANTIGPGSIPVLPGQMIFHPGQAGEHSVVRWTVPAAGTYAVSARFVGADTLPTTTDVHVWHNGVSLFDGVVNRFRVGPYLETTVTVAAGDTLEFRVGVGSNGNFTSDSTALDAVITPVSSALSQDNTIGGLTSAARNVIAFNGGSGVSVNDASVAVVGNILTGNDRLGIDLAGGTEDSNGVTTNDPDGLPTYPVLTSIRTTQMVKATVFGSLVGDPDTRFRLEFFASPAADPSGHGEGGRFIGSADVTTDPLGHADFSPELAIELAAGQWVTATATRLNDDWIPVESSEFSAAVQAVGDNPPLIELATVKYEVSEGVEYAVLTVHRTGGLDASASIDFTTVAGTATEPVILAGRGAYDYSTTAGTLSFRPRANTATIKVPIRDDTRLEEAETFQVVLSNPSVGATLGTNTSAEVVIHDNDPTVEFVAASSARREGAAGRNQIEIRLRAPTTRTVTVAYAAVAGSAAAGLDFKPSSGTITFRPGETRKFIPVRVVDDARYEGDETAIFELSSPTNAFLGTQVRHRLKIADNDPEPPPQEPGDTPDTALAVDLAALPRQSVREILSSIDIDLYRVRLAAGEALVIDVDPEPVRIGAQVLFPGLASSRLVITAADGSMAPVVIGGSAEPDTGETSGNPATLFRAPAAGEYSLDLQTLGSTIGGYRIHFLRLGVAERVPDPGLLNIPGPMLAWYDGEDTVGVTGPTGYGFTLTGPWQQETLFNRRTGLTSQTLNLPVGSQFTLASPQGVALPLVANGPIIIATKAYRWGDSVGEVKTPAIALPVSLGIAPVNNLLKSTFGSDILSVGLLTGNWRISLGGSVLADGTRDISAPIDALLAGVPYLRQKGPIQASAQLGSFTLSTGLTDKPVDWAFDPGDPMLYVRLTELGQAKKPALAISLHGLLEFNPLDAPAEGIDAGMTHFFGHVLATAKFPLKAGPIPMEIDAEAIYNVDADRDGLLLGDLRDVHELFDVLDGDISEVREILNDVQYGANGRLEAVFNGFGFRSELGRASLVVNGPEEAVWLRGQQSGDNPLAGTPLEKLNTATTIVLEGMITWDGDFFLSTTTTQKLAGISLEYNIMLTDEGISARVTGRLEWKVRFDYGLGTVSGKAIAQITGGVEIRFDDPEEPHWSGDATSTGRLVYKDKNVFKGDIESSIRSKGFRFRFPRGVGSLDLDIFD